MRNIVTKTLCLLFLFSLSISFQLKAEGVRPADSKKVALNAFSYYSGKAPSELRIVQEIPVSLRDTALLHIYNFEKGFIIVAADNAVEPILGFGLNSKFDFEDMPPALQFLLESYQEEILYAKRQNIRSSQEVNAKWNEHLSSNPSKTLYTPATWLISTKWNQSGGNESGSIVGYNYYCPTNAQGTKTLVGCGGVALAQILRYWSCNVYPHGLVNYTSTMNSYSTSININLTGQSYDWISMHPNKANIYNAYFLYHCAAALHSTFGTTAQGGTSSNPDTVHLILKNHFGFSNVTHVIRDNYSGDWIGLLKSNIDNRRPIFYAGYKKENDTLKNGHGWVVDGYNSSNYFHCNWGWGGGNVDWDGWYLLSNLTPNGKYYNDVHKATVNIYPTYHAYPSISLQNITIPSNTYTGRNIRVENCTVQNNANVILKGNCAIEICGPFTVPLGATFQATP